MLDLDSSITQKDNKDGLLKQKKNISSFYGDLIWSHLSLL